MEEEKEPIKHHKHLIKAFENFRKVELEEFRSYLKSPWRIFWANFLAGTARGLGYFLGVAAIITIAGYMIKEVLANIPIVGHFFEALNTWIQQTLEKTQDVRPSP